MCSGFDEERRRAQQGSATWSRGPGDVTDQRFDSVPQDPPILDRSSGEISQPNAKLDEFWRPIRLAFLPNDCGMLGKAFGDCFERRMPGVDDSFSLSIESAEGANHFFGNLTVRRSDGCWGSRMIRHACGGSCSGKVVVLQGNHNPLCWVKLGRIQRTNELGFGQTIWKPREAWRPPE